MRTIVSLKKLLHEQAHKEIFRRKLTHSFNKEIFNKEIFNKETFNKETFNKETQMSKEKPHINLCIIGHVDSGQ